MAVLNLLAESDGVLQRHLSDSKRNAKYTSKTVQNEMIQLMGDFIRDEGTKDLRDGDALFSLIADEVTDISNKEILSLCVRFVSSSHNIQIQEIFLDFVSLEGITGELITKAIIETLKKHRIDITKCRGQCYDGASSMSSEKVGVQCRIREYSETAFYTHCNSHVLNLSVAASCKLPPVRNMVDSINEIYLIFSNSPKRQRVFEAFIEHSTLSSKAKKLKGLCKTRWVERHLCFDTMYELFGAICSTYEYILDPKSIEIDNAELPVEWDRETRVKAQGLLSVMKSSSFLVAFVTVKNVLEIIKPLTVKLQKRDIDIVDAYNLIDSTKREVKDLRARIGNEDFSVWFKDAEHLATVANSLITTPRLAGKQRYRANAECSNAEEYFLRNVAIPFCDFISSKLATRFSEDNRAGKAMFSLLPKSVVKVDISDTLEGLSTWDNDLQSPSSLRHEISAWKRKWSTIETIDSKYDNMIGCLTEIDGDVFPNLQKLFVIGCTLPVTSCEAERSFSVHKRTKTYLRSTMTEERLSGLALMNIYPSVQLDIEELTKRFVQMHARPIEI
ncbi:hypothetical protein FSP39_001685 [Pinctada imbricata]|uniref:Uncharacterized protein n=1 Tax=Pinctada imbricata TaxID=66713 RepID=A0AA88XXN7_PINIB|nr:hypothetical protein FSP39_001685 [Pinctada imbricata]